MEKLKLKNINVIDRTDESLDVVYKSSEAKAIIHELAVDQEELINNLSKFLYLIDENEYCLNCTSKSDCKKASPGYKYTIKRNSFGDLIGAYVVCSFYHDYHVKRKNLLYSNYDEKLILTSNPISHSLINDTIMSLLNLVCKKKTGGEYIVVEDFRKEKKMYFSLIYNFLNTHTCSVIKTSLFLQDIKRSFGNSGEQKEIIDSINKSQILFIVDLGSESISQWSRDEVLYPLLDYRLENDLITIILSPYKLGVLKMLYKIGNDEIKAEKFVNLIKQIAD